MMQLFVGKSVDTAIPDGAKLGITIAKGLKYGKLESLIDEFEQSIV